MQNVDLNGSFAYVALQLNLRIRPVVMGVADNVVDGFIDSKDQRVGLGVIEAAGLARGLHEAAGQRHQPEIARQIQC